MVNQSENQASQPADLSAPLGICPLMSGCMGMVQQLPPGAVKLPGYDGARTSITSHVLPVPCMGEKCGWWTSARACAIGVISSSLDELAINSQRPNGATPSAATVEALEKLTNTLELSRPGQAAVLQQIISSLQRSQAKQMKGIDKIGDYTKEMTRAVKLLANLFSKYIIGQEADKGGKKPAGRDAAKH